MLIEKKNRESHWALGTGHWALWALATVAMTSRNNRFLGGVQFEKNTTDSCQPSSPTRPNPTSRPLPGLRLRHRQAANQRRWRRRWLPMSTTSGSPGTPSRGWPSARGHSGGSPGTPSRRRATARGHNGGRALDSGICVLPLPPLLSPLVIGPAFHV